MDRRYAVEIEWTGNLGEGTAHYRAYSRNHEIRGAGKAAPIAGSSDPVFRGDATRYNPDELLIAAASACHMLWMLHLCADAGIVVTAYADAAAGVLKENPDGSGRITEVMLHPRITITDGARAGEVDALHTRAHGLCAIAASLNCPVRVTPTTVSA